MVTAVKIDRGLDGFPRMAPPKGFPAHCVKKSVKSVKSVDRFSLFEVYPVRDDCCGYCWRCARTTRTAFW
jgi:hypothetical protein